jgi:ABC transporter substrate binding protein (PQQ-dependent alcohol dehydrogenase system)
VFDHRLPRNGDDARVETSASRFDDKDLPRGMFTFQAKLNRPSRGPLGSRELKALCALFVTALTLIASAVQPAEADPLAIKVGVIHEAHSRETISILDVPPADDFVAGARMAMDDNNTTGRFLDQSFSIVDAKLAPGDDPVGPLKDMLADGVRFFIVDLPAAGVLAVADATRPLGALVFNAGAPDDRLREEDCRADVIHVAPTRSMLTDGLAQYLIWKQWRRWLLVVGSHPEDQLLAEAYRRSAKKFGAKIVEERVFQDTGGGRRSDSGSVQVQRQMPVFTQNAPDYDVLVAADESEVFAGYLPYRTWNPRPVVGSAGLRPVSWDPSHEFWGAVQLQNRFQRLFKRGMNERDNQAWVAMRLIGDAVAHTKSADPKAIHDELLSPSFALGAFKGQGLTVRDWNQQLRQPILLTDGQGTVSVSPQEGFLHQTSELDTLGFDRPETKCKLQ